MSKLKKKSEMEVNFPGFGHHSVPGQFFKYPMILEEYWHVMTGSEHKVLTFILRQTYGWRKQGDSISVSQFVDGNVTGEGVGLSRAQVKRTLAQLEKKGFIKVVKHSHRPSYFELPLNDEAKRMQENGSFKDEETVKWHQSIENGLYVDTVNYLKIRP